MNVTKFQDNYYTECDVIMLPANNKNISNSIIEYSEIMSGCEQSGWYSEFRLIEPYEKIGDFGSYTITNPQHLYILSDETIKEGDIVLVKNRVGDYFTDLVLKVTERGIWTSNEQNHGPYYYPYIVDSETTCKKIIATTNSSLKTFQCCLKGHKGCENCEDGYKSLPQISNAFINNFILEFSKDNVINKVLVEVITADKWDDKAKGLFNQANWNAIKKLCKSVIKVDSNTNEIVIITKPKYRLGKKQNRAVLDADGNEIVTFPKGKEDMAKEYVDFLNSK